MSEVYADTAGWVDVAEVVDVRRRGHADPRPLHRAGAGNGEEVERVVEAGGLVGAEGVAGHRTRSSAAADAPAPGLCYAVAWLGSSKTPSKFLKASQANGQFCSGKGSVRVRTVPP